MTASAPDRRSWRWRQCPACGNVERASDFTILQYGEPWQHGGIRRRCPNCSHVAPTFAFRVVWEKRP